MKSMLLRLMRRLTDCLISSNGIISQKLAGRVRYMDSTYALCLVVYSANPYVAVLYPQRGGTAAGHYHEVERHLIAAL
jgi:hypothetical protein